MGNVISQILRVEVPTGDMCSLDFYLSYSKNRNTELNVMVTGEPIFITDYTDSLGCVT